MEKITITRLGEPKVVNYTNKKTGKPDSFNKIGIQSQEHGAQWMDFTFRGNHGLSVGQVIEGDVVSRDYNGKTYYDFKLPKKATQATTSDEAASLLKLQVIPMLKTIWEKLERMEGKDVVPTADDGYPPMDESNIPAF